MSEDDNWNKVEVPNEEKQIEIEVEEDKEEELPASTEEETKEDKEETPELEGIETKGAEKRIRQLVRQRKDRDEELVSKDSMIADLIQKNDALINDIRTQDKKVNQVTKLNLDSSEKQIKDKLELARTVYMEAFEEGDKERVLKAQEMLNEAQTDLKIISSAKENYKEIKEPEPVQQKQRHVQPQRKTDPKAEEWAENNSWFGQDNVKTAAALAIDAELKGEGYDPSDKEFYQEIDNRLNKAFSKDKGEVQERVQENTSSPAQVVSGASRLSPSSSTKVKLSKEDIRLAQKWNIPLEQYAAEKLKVSDADGSYVNVN